MFKGRSTVHRFHELQKISTPATSRLNLSSQDVQLIEKTNVLSLAEKIELLSISLGHKLTGELFSTIVYKENAISGRQEATPESIQPIDTLLQQLSFPYYIDNVLRDTRVEDHKPQQLTWFQVCLNEQVKSFMQNYANELTDIEEGILYGYPISAIRAFALLIEPNHDIESESIAKQYLGAGVPSKDFFEEEEAYYQVHWNQLRELSEKLVTEAETLSS